MKFVVARTSNWYHPTVREFSTLEEVVNFMEQVDEEIIISKNQYLDGFFYSLPSNVREKVEPIPYMIEIYDGCRE